MKKHRELIQKGIFYRINNPFDEGVACWIVVSEDQSEALAGYYRYMGVPNAAWDRFYLKGLDEHKQYYINHDHSRGFYGDELMYAGMPMEHNGCCESNLDFTSDIFYFKEAR